MEEKMKIGLIQQTVGSIGGNDAILHDMLNVLKDHEVILYTFSKYNIPDITVKTKIPIKIPLFGIYQKFLMPKFNYDECDVLISLTGMNIKTSKPLIIYDQNNLGLEMDNTMIPQKYKRGLWRVYYQPFKMFNKNNINKNARYVCNSNYSKMMLDEFIPQEIDVIYPGVTINDFYTSEKQTPICMVGRISVEKNLEFAVKVLNQVSYHSVIFGNVTASNVPYFNKLKRIAKPHVTITSGTREQLRQLLAESKVYFSTSNETFGISTVEAMASGCIPIVPDGSAHPETVPIPELRYKENNIDSAVDHLNNAVNGNFDHRRDSLAKYIQKFDISKFNEKILGLIK